MKVFVIQHKERSMDYNFINMAVASSIERAKDFITVHSPKGSSYVWREHNSHGFYLIDLAERWIISEYEVL